MADDFFSPIANTKPYLKVAWEGFAGSGKTYTMVKVALGLHKRIGSQKPIVFFDTERASKFLKSIFAEAGVPVLVRESRSMADLHETMERMRAGVSDILLIDSLSHLWEGFLSSYMEKVRRTRLEFADWGVIKPAWRTEFSEPLVRDPYHIMFTGRAGYEYGTEVDERGKRQLYKSGVKMKVEGETAYEPDILVLMERYEELLQQDKLVYRVATVIKDRSTLIDGKQFKNPGYEDFAPAVERCLAEPDHRQLPQEGDTSAMFKTEEDQRAWHKQRDVLLEEIEGLLTKAWPGQSADHKKAKIEALEAGFGTSSWTKIKGSSLRPLEDGKRAITTFIAAKALEAAAAATPAA